MNKHIIKFSLALVVMIAHTATHSMFTKQIGQRLARTTRAFVRHQHETPKNMSESDLKSHLIAAVPFTGLSIASVGIACYAVGVPKEAVPFFATTGGILGAVLLSSQVSPMALAGTLATSGAIAAGVAAKRYYDEEIKPKNCEYTKTQS